MRRQSPVNRAIDSRTAHVATEIERLVAYAERRHLGVEPDGADRGEPPPLRDAALRRLAFKAPLPGPTSSTRPQRAGRPSDVSADSSADDHPSSHPPAGGSFRALLTFVSIALVAVYVLYVHRSADAAMSRATAAEQSAAELQRTAHDAVTASSARAQRAISEALTHAARAERMIEVIAAPDSRRIELSGRAAAPGAVGHALYSRSRGVIVSATDLPHPPEGHVFQVWATTATGPVSLGLAAPDAQGRVAEAYEFSSGLADSIRGFLVTLERAGGSSNPAGQAVLSN